MSPRSSTADPGDSLPWFSDAEQMLASGRAELREHPRVILSAEGLVHRLAALTPPDGLVHLLETELLATELADEHLVRGRHRHLATEPYVRRKPLRREVGLGEEELVERAWVEPRVFGGDDRCHHPIAGGRVGNRVGGGEVD